MSTLFLKLLNMSLSAGWIVLGIVTVRFLFPKMPKWIRCLLWSVVGLRLIVPFFVNSSISLLPSAQVIHDDFVQDPSIFSGIPAVNAAVNPILSQAAPQMDVSGMLIIIVWIWLAGVAGLLFYALISTLLLRKKLQVSLQVAKNVHICDTVDSPFVLGIFRPKIYLPSTLSQEHQNYVLVHERAHIRRLDHLWKPLGYLFLSVYWFNPLLWLGYGLLCRDIEQACDEKAIQQMSPEDKKQYSETLLACSAHRRQILACPVAFGEVGIKTRIKGVLNYKKPTFRVILVSLVLCVMVAVCFLTNPKPCAHAYEAETLQLPTCTQPGVQYQTCSNCAHSYTESVPMVFHNYDSGMVVIVPTCNQEGTLERSCIQCGNICRESLPLTNHTPGEPYYVDEPNCITEGQKKATCTLCKEVFVTERLLINDDHDYKLTTNVASTCAAEGEGTNTCTRCSHTVQVSLPMIEHNYKLHFERAGTCSNQGSQHWVCTGCNQTKILYTGYGTHTCQAYSWGMFCTTCGRILPDSYSTPEPEPPTIPPNTYTPFT